MAKVSAIIPAFNAEAYVRDAIGSVLAQTYGDIECVVVDDGSTDGTAAAVAEYGQRVTLVQRPNGGISVARNDGVSAASGELLAFLDADDLWMPDRVQRMADALSGSPEADAAVCSTQVVDRDLKPLGVIHQDPAVTIRDLLLCQASVASVSSNLLIRRSAFDEVGRWDERLRGSEDWLMTFRLLRRDRLVAVLEPLVQYRVHGTNMSVSAERLERDMLRAFDLVPWESDAELGRLRRRAYANLHRMIAGAYFVQGKVAAFARHALRSIATHPSTLPYFLRLPVRRLRRTLGSSEALPSPYSAGTSSR